MSHVVDVKAVHLFRVIDIKVILEGKITQKGHLLMYLSNIMSQQIFKAQSKSAKKNVNCF